MTRKMDCGDEGCGECQVCRYLNHLERAGACASPGDTIEHDAKIEKYLDDKYPHWRHGDGWMPDGSWKP